MQLYFICLNKYISYLIITYYMFVVFFRSCDTIICSIICINIKYYVLVAFMCHVILLFVVLTVLICYTIVYHIELIAFFVLIMLA